MFHEITLKTHLMIHRINTIITFLEQIHRLCEQLKEDLALDASLPALEIPHVTDLLEPADPDPVPEEIEVAETVDPAATAPTWQKTQRGDLVVHANGNIDICKLSKQQRSVALAMKDAPGGILDYTVAVELVRPKSDRKKRIPLETLERRLRTVLSKINRKIKDLCTGAPLFYYNDLSVKVF